MATIDDVYSLLIAEEGNKLLVYDDSDSLPLKLGDKIIGHPTIGVGRALDLEGITALESDYLLRNDVNRWEATLQEKFPWFSELDEVRKAALISMAHTMGIGSSSSGKGLLGFHDMIAALGKVPTDYQAAHDAVLDSSWAKGKAEPRAQRTAKMLLTGKWP